MNLGDGLTFEVQDGKPKLVFAKYGLESKNVKKVNFRSKGIKLYPKSQQLPLDSQTRNAVLAPKIIGTQPSDSKKTDTEKLSAKVRKEAESSNIQLKNGDGDESNKKDLYERKTSVTHPKTLEPHKMKTVKKSEIPKHLPKLNKRVSADILRDSLVCLTQDQLQQILATITQGVKSVKPEEGNTAEISSATDAKPENAADGEAREETLQSSNSVEKTEQKNPDDPVKTQKDLSSDVSAGLFSTLGEREQAKEQLEAKKAQWKKELDEQLALRKQQKDMNQDTRLKPWKKVENANPVHLAPENPLNLPPLNDGSSVVLETRSETTRSSEKNSNMSHAQSEKPAIFPQQDVPAAIRSSFILGEAAPLEHAFSAKKREQQKLWLEELDRQKEEAKIRKMKEKEKRLQAEDHDKWAAHFDSFQRTKVSPLNTARSEPSEPARHPDEREISSSAAYTNANGNVSSSYADNLGRVSTEGNVFGVTRNTYLRSMTALLDPAQIEERERKRQKQIEHQEAIKAQVEERRRQKHLEDELRRREEQEEEQRLAQEREMMERQFEDDMRKQREKEESHSQQTRDLYMSMQKAQEDAVKQKQEQRMRSLARKGHDISNLQKHLEEGISSQASNNAMQSRLSDYVHDSTEKEAVEKMSSNIHPEKKETAVQTDGEISQRYEDKHAKERLDRRIGLDTPDVPIEYHQQTNVKKVRRDPKPAEKRKVTGKENLSSQDDQYEPYARTEKRTGRRSEKNVRKPEWNTNKPVRQYVPASERYPSGLQKEREESRLKRQLELLTLAEKNAPVKLLHKIRSTSPVGESKREEYSDSASNVSYLEKRSHSPPVPALKHRLHQQKRAKSPPFPDDHLSSEKLKRIQAMLYLQQQEAIEDNAGPERPPSSHFIPYVRTDEIYHLDPNAPISRPSTHDPQRREPNGLHQPRQSHSSGNTRDPLLNPELLKTKERQQAILKGLSELRQGLLQKQKELETGLSPLAAEFNGNFSPL
ncbi:coiled-coil domain-containing protein 66 isoform X1 [Polypterus senegalus]|uniref:coiled-coil domain-containing protein 66 isoform X1 n=1 Tax=Polypterus senegalus TaxID=55291 RepID=UPI0019661296|nr:coiled-coil domain-containing protein 66 isoform X1 [Polypterus senegalus]